MAESLLLQPKPVLFDTSTWDLVMKIDSGFDYGAFVRDGLIPFLTIEIFLELMNVSADLRRKRLDYLSKLPMLATIRFNSTYLGSISDLRSFEYQFFWSPNSSVTVSEHIKKNVVYFNGNELNFFRGIDLDGFIQSQNLDHVSISQSIWKQFSDPKIRFKKLKDIEFLGEVSPEELAGNRRRVVEHLVANADKRKSTLVKREAAESFGERLEFQQNVTNGGKNPLFAIAKMMGKELRELDSEQTLQELFDSYEYALKLRNFAKYLGCPEEELVAIEPSSIISWQVEKFYQRVYEEKLLSDTNRSAESSSVVDKHQAAFSGYFLVVVDKRSREILDTLERDKKLGLLYVFVNSVDGLNRLVNS